jgi:hypothetical protein
VSILELTRKVTVTVDGPVDLAGLEQAAVEFARTAPARLVGATIDGLVEALLDEIVGPAGLPIPAGQQQRAPWACTGCGVIDGGYARRGSRATPRRVATTCGVVEFNARVVECLACGCRFSFVGQLLGLKPYQRRSAELSRQAAGLACEVAYAKASRLLDELSGVGVSGRTIRQDVVAMAPSRLGPQVTGRVPIVMLDGTGERAGDAKRGVELHLAIGLVTRRTKAGRSAVQARLLAATLDEPWTAMAPLLADIQPGLVVVDGEPALDDLAAALWPGTPVQRCLFHLLRGLGHTLWKDQASEELKTLLHDRLAQLLIDAYRGAGYDEVLVRYDQLIGIAHAFAHDHTATYLRNARPTAFTFMTNPDAGRLVAGDKGRPELGTGVLERVMRELNRRTDVGVRWSIPGLRALLMLKLARKYDHPAWSNLGPPQPNTNVQMCLAA